ncbi:hypothetical protein PoB_006901300 [Plakobranchus ocellatus]|uniref:Secreted protein n=1 Tax=Plakobranchus ocellatus TaxID=259542 RepID=A0AAV4DE51_9GAST|nr:hypothetical protein PoB_006901300 [Plakobranchus ocellatus]
MVARLFACSALIRKSDGFESERTPRIYLLFRFPCPLWTVLTEHVAWKARTDNPMAVRKKIPGSNLLVPLNWISVWDSLCFHFNGSGFNVSLCNFTVRVGSYREALPRRKSRWEIK